MGLSNTLKTDCVKKTEDDKNMCNDKDILKKEVNYIYTCKYLVKIKFST